MRDHFRRCRACGEYHWASAWPDNHREPQPERSSLPKPYVISDTMDLLLHPVDSQYYDSKSHFRTVTERSGNIEMGNDVQEDRREYDLITPAEVAEAKQMVEQGYRPAPEQATADETVSAL